MKSENLLLDADGYLKLVDFGFSKVALSQLQPESQPESQLKRCQHAFTPPRTHS